MATSIANTILFFVCSCSIALTVSCYVLLHVLVCAQSSGKVVLTSSFHCVEFSDQVLESSYVG